MAVQKIGTWLILAEYENTKSRFPKCLCRCSVCGKEKIYNKSTLLYTRVICKGCKPTVKKPKGQSSICIDCENSCGLCSWSAKFKPVKGWTATARKKYIQTGNKTVQGYKVTACPQFQERK